MSAELLESREVGDTAVSEAHTYRERRDESALVYLTISTANTYETRIDIDNHRSTREDTNHSCKLEGR
jgi:hypothetical protein